MKSLFYKVVNKIIFWVDGIPLFLAIKLFRLYDDTFDYNNSVIKKKPIDRHGNPLPWLTYTTIHFLQKLDLSNKTILEYGSGYSTLFFANKAKQVFSVEHNSEWYNFLKVQLPPNVKLYLKEKEDDYSKFPQEICIKFDLIVIDGAFRNKCVDVATDFLNDNGMIILDNAERYPDLCSNLRKKGLVQVDMYGMGPINTHMWTTSLFFAGDWNFFDETVNKNVASNANEISIKNLS